jgi:hypothetical protein
MGLFRKRDNPKTDAFGNRIGAGANPVTPDPVADPGPPPPEPSPAQEVAAEEAEVSKLDPAGPASTDAPDPTLGDPELAQLVALDAQENPDPTLAPPPDPGPLPDPPAPEPPPAVPPGGWANWDATQSSDPLDALEALAYQHKRGEISDADFQARKAELLGRL